MRSTVVLPDPDGPSIAKNSPSYTSRSMLSTAVTGPNVLRRARREIWALGIASGPVLASTSSAAEATDSEEKRGTSARNPGISAFLGTVRVAAMEARHGIGSQEPSVTIG